MFSKWITYESQPSRVYLLICSRKYIHGTVHYTSHSNDMESLLLYILICCYQIWCKLVILLLIYRADAFVVQNAPTHIFSSVYTFIVRMFNAHHACGVGVHTTYLII